MRLAPLLSLLGALFLAVPSPAQRPISVPVSREWRGLMQVPVTLNGHVPARFIVDTAATATLLSADTVSRLGLTGSGQPAYVEGATGGKALNHYRLRSLAVGGAVHRDIDAYDLPPIEARFEADGLLGADVLRRHVVIFDGPNRAMLLYPARFDPRGLAGEWSAVPARQRDNGVLIVAVRIGDATIPALVDTGAVHDFVNRPAAELLGLAPTAAPEPIGGASGHIQAMIPVALPPFAIGEARFASSRAGIVDLAIFETLGLADGPAMILGAETLASRRFVIDYPRSRILIER